MHSKCYTSARTIQIIQLLSVFNFLFSNSNPNRIPFGKNLFPISTTSYEGSWTRIKYKYHNQFYFFFSEQRKHYLNIWHKNYLSAHFYVLMLIVVHYRCYHDFRIVCCILQEACTYLKIMCKL